MYVTNFKTIETKSISTCLKLLVNIFLRGQLLSGYFPALVGFYRALRIASVGQCITRDASATPPAHLLNPHSVQLLRRLSSSENQKTPQNKPASFLSLSLSSLESVALSYQFQWSLAQTHTTQQTSEAEHCISIMLLNCISSKIVKSKFHFTYDNNFFLQLSCKSENKIHPHFRPILLPCLYILFLFWHQQPFYQTPLIGSSGDIFDSMVTGSTLKDTIPTARRQH